LYAEERIGRCNAPFAGAYAFDSALSWEATAATNPRWVITVTTYASVGSLCTGAGTQVSVLRNNVSPSCVPIATLLSNAGTGSVSISISRNIMFAVVYATNTCAQAGSLSAVENSVCHQLADGFGGLIDARVSWGEEDRPFQVHASKYSSSDDTCSAGLTTSSSPVISNADCVPASTLFGTGTGSMQPIIHGDVLTGNLFAAANCTGPTDHIVATNPGLCLAPLPSGVVAVDSSFSWTDALPATSTTTQTTATIIQTTTATTMQTTTTASATTTAAPTTTASAASLLSHIALPLLFLLLLLCVFIN